jgi:hypothetical protein
MDDLPVELYTEIVNSTSNGEAVYYNLLTIKKFALSLTPSQIMDYRISFGYSVKITKDAITWLKNNKEHRGNDLPAVEWVNGNRTWSRNGKAHRDGDLPAFIDIKGVHIWYKDGEKHRDGDLPAYISMDVTVWMVNGKKHRTGNRPAVIRAHWGCSTTHQFWIDGESIRPKKARTGKPRKRTRARARRRLKSLSIKL